MKSPSYCANDFGPELELKLRRGASFDRVVQWMTEPLIYRTVASIVSTAPCTLRLASGGVPVPDSWLVAIPDLIEALGVPKYQPAPISQYYRADVDGDTITLQDLDISDVPDFRTPSKIQFKTPASLVAVTAQLEVHADDDPDSDVIFTMSSANGLIQVVPALQQIRLHLSIAQVKALLWTKGFYFLTVKTPEQEGIRLLTGPISVH